MIPLRCISDNLNTLIYHLLFMKTKKHITANFLYITLSEIDLIMGILKNIRVVGNEIYAPSAYLSNLDYENVIIAMFIIYLLNDWFISVSDFHKQIIYNISISRVDHGYNDI